MLGYDKLIDGYCVDEFLTEELSLLANAQLLLDLVKERKYLGIKRSINKLAIEE